MTKKKTVNRTKSKKGAKFVCTDCGLVVTVDRDCGCLDMHELTCCGRPMKLKRTRK